MSIALVSGASTFLHKCPKCLFGCARRCVWWLNYSSIDCDQIKFVWVILLIKRFTALHRSVRAVFVSNVWWVLPIQYDIIPLVCMRPGECLCSAKEATDVQRVEVTFRDLIPRRWIHSSGCNTGWVWHDFGARLPGDGMLWLVWPFEISRRSTACRIIEDDTEVIVCVCGCLSVCFGPDIRGAIKRQGTRT